MRILKITITIFIIILGISLYFLINDFSEYKRSNDAIIELTETVINKEESVDIDWNKLKDINKDIIGWIKIDDTNINYPILKDDDSLKYIYISFDGSYNKNGAIFTLNNNPFEDNITTIYGHNMKTGIMFSELSKYMNKEFWNKHSTFSIYTENQEYKAKVFSCYSIGVDTEENNIKSLNFKEEIEYYKKMSKYSIENMGEIKKILKLSTCSYLNNRTIPTDQRYYIVASLEKVY